MWEKSFGFSRDVVGLLVSVPQFEKSCICTSFSYVLIAKPKKSLLLYHLINSKSKIRASTNFPLERRGRVWFGDVLLFPTPTERKIEACGLGVVRLL
jgi:hypothetical protein